MSDRALYEVEQLLREHFREVMELADQGRAPVAVVECPRGHVITAVRVEPDCNLHPALLYVTPSGKQISQRARPRATSADGRSVGEVCWEPGCHLDRPCPEHDDESQEMAASAVGDRDRLQCPHCAYDGRHGQVDLLKRYAVAVEISRRAGPGLTTKPRILLTA